MRSSSPLSLHGKALYAHRTSQRWHSWALLRSVELTHQLSVFKSIWVMDSRLAQRVQQLLCMPPSLGALIKALGSEDLASISCCGHSDTVSSRKSLIFGLHPDFQEGHACGPMGLERLWRQKSLDSPFIFVPHWLMTKGKLPNSYNFNVFSKGTYWS